MSEEIKKYKKTRWGKFKFRLSVIWAVITSKQFAFLFYDPKTEYVNGMTSGHITIPQLDGIRKIFYLQIKATELARQKLNEEQSHLINIANKIIKEPVNEG